MQARVKVRREERLRTYHDSQATSAPTRFHIVTDLLASGPVVISKFPIFIVDSSSNLIITSRRNLTAFAYSTVIHDEELPSSDIVDSTDLPLQNLWIHDWKTKYIARVTRKGSCAYVAKPDRHHAPQIQELTRASVSCA